MGSGPSTSPPSSAQGSCGGERVSDEEPPPRPAQGPRGEERVNGYREYQEIMLRIANNPDMGTPCNPRQIPEPWCGMSASYRADSLLYDYDFGDEDTTKLCEEAAYCRAAADSHAGIDTPYDPGAAEAGSTPFKGQGSVMYSYRESSKMRFGTLNVKGSIQGAPGVSRHCVQCLLVP
jgi:hypothetical protein